jgi:GT2 family glycosyltransferase
MNIAIVVVTHNRFDYTEKTIERLLSSTEEFDIYLWDNASKDETPEYLNSMKDPRIVEIILSKENVGQTGAMNYVWSKTKAELVGKVDNDCLPAPNWTEILAQAHQDISNLGAVACWHFRAEDFDYELAKHKIQRFGKHQIFRHPWVGGTGFLLKRKTFLEIGSWDEGPDVGTTHYFLKMALAGYINGWYYPLIYQEHMDDPVSEYSVLKDDAAIEKMYDITYTLRTHSIKTMKERLQWRKIVLRNLLCGPWEAKYYFGWRGKLRRIKRKLKRKLSGVCGFGERVYKNRTDR